MDTKEKIAKLQAIKEEFAATQNRLMEARKLEEAAQATHLSTLLEADLAQAEIILAAKDIMATLQDMAEDLAKLNAQEIFPLVDEMKAAFGPEAAEAFENVAQGVLQDALNSVRKAKEDINTSILQVEGKLPMNDMAMGTEEPEASAPAPDMSAPEIDGVDAEVSDDTILGGADDFGGAEAGAMGRAKKESIEGGAVLEGKTRKYDDEDMEDSKAQKKADKEFRNERKSKRQVEEGKTHKYDDEDMDDAKSAKKADKEFRQARKDKKKIDESIIMETAGQKLIESEGLVSLLTWYLKEAAAALPADEYPEFAAKVSAKAAKNPNKMAGYIGQKKYGHAAMAQLATPTFTAMEQVMEGRSFRYDDEEYGDAKSQRKQDKAWRQSRKAKRQVDDNGGDDEEEKMTESQRMALAMSKVIESNVLAFGKGNAAQVVKQFSEHTLSEGNEQTVMEAFIEMFEMRPAQYSIALAREISEADLNPNDQKKVNSAMAKVAGQMATDKSMANKPVSAVLNTLDPQERAAVQKKQTQMRQDGQDPKKVADLVGSVANVEESLEENINAAHWPIDTMGQYKGTVVEPDLEPLKAPKAETKTAAPSEKSAEPKAETSSEEPKQEAAEETPAEEPKEEKNENPFAKKD